MSRLRFDDSIPSGEMIARMAADLVRLKISGGEADAIRALASLGTYGFGDIAAFADDALIEAKRRAAQA